MPLQTRRLLLRDFTADDARLLFDLDRDPEVVRYVGPPDTLEEIEAHTLPYFLELARAHPGLGFFAAIEKSSSEFIGWFHFRPVGDATGEIELGYRLHCRFWGRGYGTEGSLALIERGFAEQGVQRVVAWALLANTASIRVMEKCGMTLHSQYEQPSMPAPGNIAVRYGLERDSYLQRNLRTPR